MRIGLVAMSGIRCCDTELLELGLTLPGFVERSKTIASLPSLGLLTLAGMTPEAHEVQWFEVADLETCGGLPDGLDLVAISSYSAQIDEAYELASRCKEAGTPVVMGGPHVTALPEEAKAYCDSVVMGEGESHWLDVLRDCGLGALKPFYEPPDGGFDLADAPIPAFELLDADRYNRLLVQASRGCPHRCEFCAASVTLTDRYKQKPVGKVLAEIDRILEIWDHPFIEFADDNAFVNKAYWKELLSALGPRRIRWFAETDVSVGEDDELLQLMRAHGCAQLLIGLESPVAEDLDGLETRTNWKYERCPHYREMIARIQAHKITVNGCFVLGLDNQTSDIFDHVYEFVRDSGLYEVQVTVQTAFPGTPLYERLLAEGRLLEPRNWRKCTLFDVNYRPQNMTVEELRQGLRDLVLRLYAQETVDQRRRDFFKRLGS